MTKKTARARGYLVAANSCAGNRAGVFAQSCGNRAKRRAGFAGVACFFRNLSSVILVIFALFVPLFGAEHYIFSYRVAVRDSVVISERYNFSKAMVIPSKYETLGECQFLPEDGRVSALKYLKDSHEEVLNCLFRHGVGLRDDTSANKHRSKSTTTLQMTPTLVVVECEGGLIIMKIVQPK